MSQEVNKEKIKQCLKDANMYEENMSEDLMNEYYKAIKNSETSLIEEKDKSQNPLEEAEKSLNESANELLEAINNSESVAPSNKKGNDTFSKDDDDDDDDSLDAFSQDILHRAKSRLKEEEEEANNNNNNINIEDDKPEKSNEVLDIKKTPIGFNDMPKSENIEKNMLKIISHELKFINIQNSKKFLTSDSETRIKMLCNYHIAAAKLKAHFASLSSSMAPMGKPITAIDHDLCVNPVISSLKEEELLLSHETTYISRSGRLTKRKVYNEVDEFSQDAFSNAKKSKNDDDWMSKSSSKEKTTKIISKKDSSDKDVHALTEKTTNKAVITRSESPDSSQSDMLVAETRVDKFDELKENTPVAPKPRTYQRKHASNDEIMTRSSLFKDTPKKGRTEALLNAAKEEIEKKKRQAEEIERFTNSLDLDSQTFEDESEKIIVDDDEEIFEKKRVIPPLPGRRSIHGRKRGGGAGPEPLGISTKKPNLNTSLEEINSTPLVNGASRRTALPRRSSSNSTEARGEPSSSSVSRGKKEVNMTPCPLCSVSFPQKEIEEHAATCGEDMFAQTPQPKLTRITCEICDQVVPLTTEYEVHVKECIVKKNSGNGLH